MVEIRTASSMDHARRRATAALSEALACDGPTLLLVSGGSALALLQEVPENVQWENVTCGLIDERWRAPKCDRNQDAFLQTPLAQAALRGSAAFLEVSHATQSLSESAQDYEDALRAWHGTHPHGRVVAILGIGPDGHTAGIMPFPEDPETFQSLFEAQSWVIGYDASGKNAFAQRVTVTNTYLRKYVDHAIVYAGGAQKREALHNALAQQGVVSITPARVLHAMKSVVLFSYSA